MCELAIQISLKCVDLSVQSGMIVLCTGKLSIGGVECLAGSPKLKFLRVCKLCELVRPLLSLEQIVVDSLDASIIVCALTLLHGNAVSHSIDLILIFCLLLTKSSELKTQVVCILAHGIALVSLDAAFATKGNAFRLTAADLVADSTNLSLKFIVAAILLVQKEAKILNLLTESICCHNVLIVAVIVVVVLHELFILKIAVLLLHRVKLIAQRQIVLVSLLDFEDLCLQLRDQQVLLVRSEMHRVVVLKVSGNHFRVSRFKVARLQPNSSLDFSEYIFAENIHSPLGKYEAAIIRMHTAVILLDVVLTVAILKFYLSLK